MKLKITLAVAMILGTLAGTASAQYFPEGPITWVVNWPAGGGQDTTSRLVAERLSDVLGVPIVVENYDDAGGLTGMRELAGADPDGYTIGMLGSSSVIQQYTTDEPVMMDQLQVLSFFGPDPAALTVGSGTPYDMESRLFAGAQKVCTDLELEVSFEKIGGFDPVTFDAECVSAVRAAAEYLGYSHLDIILGAGHDACWINAVIA